MAPEEKQAEQWPQGKGRKLIRYGYRLVADEIQKDPTEQEILGLIDRETKAGRNSVQIADLLNDLGYRTRNNTEWQGGYIRNLLHRHRRRASEQG